MRERYSDALGWRPCQTTSTPASEPSAHGAPRASPAGTEVCPSCGATLVTAADGGVPGLTAIDAEAVLRTAHSRSRAAACSGSCPARPATRSMPRPSPSSAPWPRPMPTSGREMLRLEIEAERQRLEDEGASLASEAAEEEGTPIPAGLFGDASDVRGSGHRRRRSMTPPGPEAKPTAPPPPPTTPAETPTPPAPAASRRLAGRRAPGTPAPVAREPRWFRTRVRLDCPRADAHPGPRPLVHPRARRARPRPHVPGGHGPAERPRRRLVGRPSCGSPTTTAAS